MFDIKLIAFGGKQIFKLLFAVKDFVVYINSFATIKPLFEFCSGYFKFRISLIQTSRYVPESMPRHMIHCRIDAFKRLQCQVTESHRFVVYRRKKL